jgi:uncharacterized oligopeptide transporter (OPT) family protein
MHAPSTVFAPGIEPATQVGEELHSPRDHPRALEPITLALTAALSVLGALIGLNLITTLGISANTSVIGALVAMLVGRVNVLGLRKMRSVHRQNLVQSAISGATFGAANSLLSPIAVLFVFGRLDLIWPMLLGASIGLLVDTWVLFRTFDSKLFPAAAAWPPGVAAAETVIAGDRGGRRAVILAGGALVGLVGTFLQLPMSAAGVALIGNIWALAMFGLGLLLRQYSVPLFGVDINTQYIPHGVMIGAGLVALGQAVALLRRSRAEPRPDGAGSEDGSIDPSRITTTSEGQLRRGLLEGYVLFAAGALLVGLLGGLPLELSPAALLGWVLFVAFAALVHEIIVGLAAMQSGWFPAFAVTLIFLVLGLVVGISPVPLALLVAYCSATGPAFADMGYDLKAGWMLRRGARPFLPVEREGRRQQYIAQLVGFGIAMAVVALTWQSYFRDQLIPPVAKVYAATITAGLTDPSVVRNLVLMAIPGALIQFLGGPKRQMGILFATGLLLLTPNAWWLVFGALLVRIIYDRVRGSAAEAETELSLVGAGIIAGNALSDSSRVLGIR